jgi:hypothetical protein
MLDDLRPYRLAMSIGKDAAVIAAAGRPMRLRPDGSGDGYEGKRFTAVNGSGERVVSVVVVVVVKRKEEEASRQGP